MKKYFSIIVPAFNEEKLIADSINSLVDNFESTNTNYEILVFNDGSTDRTGKIIDSFARANKNIKAIHRKVNRGIGASTREAIKIANGDCIGWFPGDNSITKESYREIIIFAKSMREDVLITYSKNNRKRPFLRRNLSSIYTALLNLLFGLKLKYYNGASILPVNVVRRFSLQADCHDTFAEVVVLTIKSGYSYAQFPFVHKPGTDKTSKAISLKNIFNIAKTICVLVKTIYFKH
ncbi:MAG: glycosyltransferase family 2 protein [Candidatus Omnitrophica bacterium]|nr:glycosyltransferase family 2 protein [Candidatus Omnitrophota bacterium]